MPLQKYAQPKPFIIVTFLIWDKGSSKSVISVHFIVALHYIKLSHLRFSHSQIADNGKRTVTPSISWTTNGPNQHFLPGTAGCLSNQPGQQTLILKLEVISHWYCFNNDLFYSSSGHCIQPTACTDSHGVQCNPNSPVSWHGWELMFTVVWDRSLEGNWNWFNIPQWYCKKVLQHSKTLPSLSKHRKG